MTAFLTFKNSGTLPKVLVLSWTFQKSKKMGVIKLAKFFGTQKKFSIGNMI
jgi:hypothetical protein